RDAHHAGPAPYQRPDAGRVGQRVDVGVRVRDVAIEDPELHFAAVQHFAEFPIVWAEAGEQQPNRRPKGADPGFVKAEFLVEAGRLIGIVPAPAAMDIKSRVEVPGFISVAAPVKPGSEGLADPGAVAGR